MTKTRFKTWWDDDIDEHEIEEYIHDDKWKLHREFVELYNLGRTLTHQARISRSSLKLRDKVMKDCGISIFPIVYRVYTKSKSAEEWNWWVHTERYAEDIGSNFPVRDLLKFNKLILLTSPWGTVNLIGE